MYQNKNFMVYYNGNTIHIVANNSFNSFTWTRSEETESHLTAWRYAVNMLKSKTREFG